MDFNWDVDQLWDHDVITASPLCETLQVQYFPYSWLITDCSDELVAAPLSLDSVNLEDTESSYSAPTVAEAFVPSSSVPGTPCNSFTLSYSESAPDTTNTDERSKDSRQHKQKLRHRVSNSGNSISKAKAKGAFSKQASGSLRSDGGYEEPPKLRTAPRHRPLRCHSSDAAASAIGMPGALHSARASHNKVEKKYRIRLNQQFECLLSALETDSSDSTKALSKAGVLEMARHQLELARRQVWTVSAENETLKAQIEELRSRNVRLPVTPLGGVSPRAVT